MGRIRSLIRVAASAALAAGIGFSQPVAPASAASASLVQCGAGKDRAARIDRVDPRPLSC